jgi:transcriptional regulator of NAD metabolism
MEGTMKKNKGIVRREQIKELLSMTSEPLTGAWLARRFHVSRQVIVQDIALLRMAAEPIVATGKGYVMEREDGRVHRFKVHHNLAQMEEELNIFVDAGAVVRNVLIEHPVYGTLEGRLNLANREDVQLFMKKIRAYPNAPLMNIAGGIHYHTVVAPNMEALEEIEKALKKAGILVES